MMKSVKNDLFAEKTKYRYITNETLLNMRKPRTYNNVDNLKQSRQSIVTLSKPVSDDTKQIIYSKTKRRTDPLAAAAAAAASGMKKRDLKQTYITCCMHAYPQVVHRICLVPDFLPPLLQLVSYQHVIAYPSLLNTIPSISDIKIIELKRFSAWHSTRTTPTNNYDAQ